MILLQVKVQFSNMSQIDFHPYYTQALLHDGTYATRFKLKLLERFKYYYLKIKYAVQLNRENLH